MRRNPSLVWSIASLVLIFGGFGLWLAGKGEGVLALGILVSCGGLIVRWAFGRG